LNTSIYSSFFLLNQIFIEKRLYLFKIDRFHPIHAKAMNGFYARIHKELNLTLDQKEKRGAA
tara:strand:+ start:669 stop:854 length:186 start_codon:yes stop_codon:yes gene_type:complete